MNRKQKRIVLEDLPVTAYAAEGKALGRLNGKVIFVEGAVPGDVVDVLLKKSKKDWAEGKAIAIKKYSEQRVDPFCIHFGICGGCKWQMLSYENQLEYKEQEAIKAFRRIGHFEAPPVLSIIGSEKIVHYRNKLEFTFSDKIYLPDQELKDLGTAAWPGGALGYHVPKLYDKIIDIQECWLMEDVNNEIRNGIRDFAKEKNYSFYNIKDHTGWLRNIVIRNCTTGELMVNLVFAYDDETEREKICNYLMTKVRGITTLLYTINAKWNDSLNDLEPVVVFGKGYVIEQIGKFYFKISAKSFFQTNTKQAEVLYTVVKEFAGLSGGQIVYDLYCGTGSIGIFLSAEAKKIVGVDIVDEAVNDAKENARLNNLEHASFFCGDVIKLCTDEFFQAHGYPDVIIVDPPRAGLHASLIRKLLEIQALKIVYVSCNVATQARDLDLLREKYFIEKLQPVDMFPHTHHIECVAELDLKQPAS